MRGLDHGQSPEQGRLALQQEPGHLRHDLREPPEPEAVAAVRTVALAEADDQHFDEPAFVRPGEGCMRLDPVDDEHPVGGGGVRIHMDGESVVQRTDHDRIHPRPDRASDRCGGHAQMLQHAELSFGCGPAVASHARDKKRPRPALPEPVHCRPDDLWQTGYPPGTYAYGDFPVGQEAFRHPGRIQSVTDGTGNIGEPVVRNVAGNPVQKRQFDPCE